MQVQRAEHLGLQHGPEVLPALAVEHGVVEHAGAVPDPAQLRLAVHELAHVLAHRHVGSLHPHRHPLRLQGRDPRTHLALGLATRHQHEPLRPALHQPLRQPQPQGPQAAGDQLCAREALGVAVGRGHHHLAHVPRQRHVAEGVGHLASVEGHVGQGLDGPLLQ